MDMDAAGIVAAGDRSVSVGTNQGIVQTGDRARAFLGPPVPLGRPQDVPAPVPALVGLPKPPARTFVGRADELAALATAGTRVVHGLGGVGKSELALQYAYARRDGCSSMWWVTADGPEAIESGLAELAYRLHPDGQIVATEQEAAGWALVWLRTHAEWLLVLDNVDRRRDVEPVLGELAGGSILVTTRRDIGWDEIADVVLPLGVLSPDARVWSVTLTRVHEAIPTLAVLSCLAPDDLPRDVLHHLGEERRAVDRALGILASYSMITLTGSTVTVHRLVQSVVRDQRRADGPAWAGTLRAAVRALVAAKPPGDATEQPATWPRWAALSPHVAALAAVCPDDVGGEALAGLLGEHALFDDARGRYGDKLDAEIRALRIEEQVFGADHPDVSIRLNNLSNTMIRLGHPGKAEPLQRRALAISEATWGPDHPETAAQLSNLGVCLDELGRPAEAEPLERRTLAILETAYGPGHPDVETLVHNLAMTVRRLGSATGLAEGVEEELRGEAEDHGRGGGADQGGGH